MGMFHNELEAQEAIDMMFIDPCELTMYNDMCALWWRDYPFPNMMLDGFFEYDALDELHSKFPKIDDQVWWQYDNPLEKKYAFNDLSKLDPIFTRYFDEVNSTPFLAFLEKVSGLSGLIPDPGLNGGGLHQSVRGGKLDIHEDYNVHKELNAYRRLNVITYLNKNWDMSWRGEMQFWDAEMKHLRRVIPPLFNRIVIFRTDMDSNHGFPDPLMCPESESRKSLATYYYTPIPEGQIVEYRSTSYKKTPEQPDDPEIESLRERRRHGRLEDKRTK